MRRTQDVMVHLYLCLPDRCGQKIHKSKGDRQCKIGQKENVCLFCSYVFSVCTGQADIGINAPLDIAARGEAWALRSFRTISNSKGRYTKIRD